MTPELSPTEETDLVQEDPERTDVQRRLVIIRHVRMWWARLSLARKVFSALVGVLGTFMLFVGIWDRFGPENDPVVPMSGDLNVAVAQFGTATKPGEVRVTEASAAMATSVYELLESELDAVAEYDIEVRAPEETGRLAGSSPKERATSAARLTAESRADVLIYGVLQHNATSLTPEFYMSDRLLPGAEELAGHYKLGGALTQPASIEENVVARSELRRELLKRSSGIVRFISGLSHFALNDYQTARDAFKRIDNEGLFRQGTDEHILSLFLGHAAGQLGDFDAAEAHYEEALATRPSYARALIGIAEIRFQRSHNGCKDSAIHAGGVRRARDGYIRARNSGDRPPHSNIETKAALGVGRALLCLSLAGVEGRWDEAQHQFRTVTDAYEQGNDRVADLAAEAWSSLGLIEVQGAEGDERQFRAAAEAFEKAIAVSTRADRQSLWYGYLGYTYCKLGRRRDAVEAYEAAREMAPDEATRLEYEDPKSAGCESVDAPGGATGVPR